MNKRGETTLPAVIRLVLVLVLVIAFGGCAYKSYFLSRECPAGYDLLVEPPTGFGYESFCGSMEQQEAFEYRCCRRKSDISEVCKYDLELKEVTVCKDLNSFDEMYKATRTCKDETRCGESNKGIGVVACAGIHCEEEGEICSVEKVGSKWEGKCINEIGLGVGGGEVVTAYFLEDGRTMCGLRAGPELFGVLCDDEEKQREFQLGLGNKCMVEKEVGGSRFVCGGTI
jgi:hypothetical protein